MLHGEELVYNGNTPHLKFPLCQQAAKEPLWCFPFGAPTVHSLGLISRMQIEELIADTKPSNALRLPVSGVCTEQ